MKSSNEICKPSLLLMPVALLAAVGAGLAVSFILSQLRAVFFDARAVRNTIGLPVLGVVTLVRTDNARLRDRRDLRLFGLASSGLVGIFVIAVVVLTFLGRTAR